MSKKKMFMLDLNRCIDCKTCVSACFNYHGINGTFRRQILTFGMEDNSYVTVSISCNHCENPICISVCPQNRFHKRPDGIVILEDGDCSDCRLCVNACPFNAPKFYDSINKVEKCNMCFDRLDQELRPICVSNCKMNALSIIEVSANEFNHLHYQSNKVLIAKYTKPSLYLVEKKESLTFL